MKTANLSVLFMMMMMLLTTFLPLTQAHEPVRIFGMKNLILAIMIAIAITIIALLVTPAQGFKLAIDGGWGGEE